MKVLLDARPTLGGTHRSTMELLLALEETLPEGGLRTFGRRAGGSAPRSHPGPARRTSRVLGGWLKRIATDQVALPVAARRHADLLHAPAGLLPLALAVPAVATVNDLTLWRRPSTKKRSPMTWYERWGARRCLSHARRIVVPSDAVAAELVRLPGVAPERVVRIYPMLPALEQAGDAPLPDAARGRYVLSVGTLEPRKNLDRLLEAHRLAWPRVRQPLLLVGAYGWRQGALLARVRASEGRVRWLGRVDDATLALLYRRATAVVQVSLEEGFDYPVAEALSLGAPVVLSDLPVHREVAGEEGLYAPAEEPGRIAARLEEAAAWTPERRAAHAAAGRAQIVRLRSVSSVADYLRVYREALAPACDAARR